MSNSKQGDQVSCDFCGNEDIDISGYRDNKQPKIIQQFLSDDQKINDLTLCVRCLDGFNELENFKWDMSCQIKELAEQQFDEFVKANAYFVKDYPDLENFAHTLSDFYEKEIGLTVRRVDYSAGGHK